MTEKMVLRTVYLPPALDEKLRLQAFKEGVSKNDLIRSAVERELAQVPGFGQEAAAAPRSVRRKPAVRRRAPAPA